MDFLPDWLSDILTLLAFFLGPTGIVLTILNARGANRKLKVDEGGLSVNQFSALNTAYKSLYETEKQTAKDAILELKSYKDERESILTEVAEVKDQQRRRDILFMQVIREHKITMTPEQQAEFDATKPRKLIKRPAVS